MKIIVKLIIVCMLIGSLHSAEVNIRKTRDKIGYFWNKTQITRLIKYLNKNEPTVINDKNFIAGISPHDDYLYAAIIYHKLFSRISPEEVVIFGVTHSGPRKELKQKDGFLIFDSFKYWEGVFKRIEVSSLRSEIIKKLPEKYYIVNNKVQELEHSVEGMIPFLQYYNKNIKITPIMVTGMDFKKMQKVSAILSNIITRYIENKKLILGKDIFFLISSDANHYGNNFKNAVFGTGEKAHIKATGFDVNIINKYLTGKISDKGIQQLTGHIWGDNYKNYGKTLWCGRYSIPFGILTVINTTRNLFRKKTLSGRLLGYSDTYSDGVIPLKKTGCGITAPFSLEHWVGYFSAGFYLESN